MHVQQVGGRDPSKVGDAANYTLTLNNTSSSDTPALNCTITDSLLGVNKSVTLASGASDVTTLAYTFKAGDPDPFTTTASVSCSPTGFSNILTGSGSATVNLFQPSISVTKTGPNYSKAGDTATYTVTIENTSSEDSPALLLMSYTDSLVSGVTPPATCDELAFGGSCSFSYNLDLDGTIHNICRNLIVRHTFFLSCKESSLSSLLRGEIIYAVL